MKKNFQFTLVIDRQVALIIGAAIGVLLIGLIGVSAHSGANPILQLAGVHETEGDDAASKARTYTKESSDASSESSESAQEKATEKPDAPPKVRPSATPSHEGGGSGD